MKIIIKTADWANGHEKLFIEESVRLIYESNPEFYDLVSPNKNDIYENLAIQLRDSHSELGHSIIIILEDVLAGISVYYPYVEMKNRQFNSLRHLVNIHSHYPDILERIKSFTLNIEPITASKSIYWARLGVKKEYRRLGIASLLSNAMEYDVKTKGFDYIYSHLNHKNEVSMKMHLGRNFSRVSNMDYTFIAMSKKVAL